MYKRKSKPMRQAMFWQVVHYDAFTFAIYRMNIFFGHFFGPAIISFARRAAF